MNRQHLKETKDQWISPTYDIYRERGKIWYMGILGNKVFICQTRIRNVLIPKDILNKVLNDDCFLKAISKS